MESKQDYLNSYYQCAKQTIEEFMKSKENEIENSYTFAKKDGSEYRLRIKLSFEQVVRDGKSISVDTSTVKRQHGKNIPILFPMLPRHFSAKKRAEIRAKEKAILIR